MKLTTILLSAVLSVGIAGTAAANPVLTDLTAADYITVGGLDWAWAAPIAEINWSTNILSAANLHEGWREASDAEWATLPAASAFGTSSNFKCAAKYWNSGYTHCDYGDAESGYVSQHLGGGGMSELFYVRDVANNVVPEPGSLALIGLGLAGLAAVRRRKSA